LEIQTTQKVFFPDPPANQIFLQKPTEIHVEAAYQGQCSRRVRTATHFLYNVKVKKTWILVSIPSYVAVAVRKERGKCIFESSV
jgi:hypothetical protein